MRTGRLSWSLLGSALIALTACQAPGAPSKIGVLLPGTLNLPSQLVSNNSSNLIGNNSASLVSNNSSSLIGNNTASYRIAAVASVGLANASILLYRLTPDALVQAGRAQTDARGTFAVQGLAMNTWYLVEATGSLKMTPLAALYTEPAAVTHDPALAGWWSGYAAPAPVLKDPLKVSVASTLVAAQLQAKLQNDPSALDHVSNQSLRSLETAVDQALSPNQVTALASGSAPTTVYQQVASDPAVTAADQSAFGQTRDTATPAPSSSPTAQPTAPPDANGSVVN